MSRGVNGHSPAAGSAPASAQQQQQHPRDRLAVLPDALLLRLFELIGRTSKRDLCAVSRLNRRYHTLSDAVLYKSILFESPELHLTFSESLGRRPRRGSAIHEVTLEYPSSELSQLALDSTVHGSHYEPSRDQPSHYDGLSRTLSIMSNLEKLDIAVPAVLLHGIGALFNGPFDLACLKTCTLFYQCRGDEYWDLRENIHIFSHPTLESLTIKRAKLDYRGFDILERPHETALKSLHLVECDINDDALADVLEFPEALEEFVMTQAAVPTPPLEESSDDLGDYAVALKSQAHSLRSVTIDHATLGSRKALRLRDFAALRTLRLNWDYQLYGRSSKKPRLHSVGLPPALETLEFFNPLGTDAEVTELFMYTIQTKRVVATTWHTLVVVAGDDEDDEDHRHGVSRELIEACEDQGLKLDIIGAMDAE